MTSPLTKPFLSNPASRICLNNSVACWAGVFDLSSGLILSKFNGASVGLTLGLAAF